MGFGCLTGSLLEGSLEIVTGGHNLSPLDQDSFEEIPKELVSNSYLSSPPEVYALGIDITFVEVVGLQFEDLPAELGVLKHPLVRGVDLPVRT